jgi:hypothetical protein
VSGDPAFNDRDFMANGAFARNGGAHLKGGNSFGFSEGPSMAIADRRRSNGVRSCTPNEENDPSPCTVPINTVFMFL